MVLNVPHIQEEWRLHRHRQVVVVVRPSDGEADPSGDRRWQAASMLGRHV